MKVTIREGVWETNSSSMHAIAISTDPIKWRLSKAFENYQGSFLRFDHGEFGWDHKIYRDVDSKASYLYEAICGLYQEDPKERERLFIWIYETLADENIAAVINPRMYDDGGYTLGYIDHSNETEDFIKYVTFDEEQLLQYLFGSGAICTSNDNSDMNNYVNFVKTYQDLGEYDIVIKGN